MRFRIGAIAVVGAALVAGCADEPAGRDTAGPSFSSVNGAAARTYVILGNGTALPGDIAEQVTAAGGSLVNAMGGIGVAVATSEDPEFASRMGRVQGIFAVAEDVVLDFDEPRNSGELEATGEPSAQDHGSTESFGALQWAPGAIGAPAAWHAGYEGAGARVAVLDGGIHNTHVDLRDRVDVARSASFVPGQPFNFDQRRNAARACVLNDTFWHGTHVAGIVAASRNGIGTVGIAPAATIVGVKVLHCGSGAFSWVISGIYYAATPISEGGGGADIINMSLGAQISGRSAGIAALLNALSRSTSYANQRGTTVIAALGNSGVDLDHTGNTVFVPAQSVGVIAVSATGPFGWAYGATDTDRLASYSNYGQSAVGFAAPGGDFAWPTNELCNVAGIVTRCWVFDMVLSTSRGSGASIGSYSWAAGTSMASPAVAGVAALIVGKNGPMHPAQLEAALRQSADDRGKPGIDDVYGHGFVNALRAVQ